MNFQASGRGVVEFGSLARAFSCRILGVLRLGTGFVSGLTRRQPVPSRSLVCLSRRAAAGRESPEACPAYVCPNPKRQEYAASGLSIKPQTHHTRIETIKEMIRALGEDPDKILTRESQTQPATTQLQPQDYDNHRLQILTQHLRQAIHGEAPTQHSRQAPQEQRRRKGGKFPKVGAAERVRYPRGRCLRHKLPFS